MSKGKKKHRSGAHKPASAKVAQETRSPERVVIALATAGLLVTGYLALVAWIDETPAFCSAGSGCDVIAQSRWSTFLGLPLALWGFFMYLFLGLTAWHAPDRLKRWSRLWTTSLVGTAISLYLTVVGILFLDAVCAWCLVSLVLIGAIFARVALNRHSAAPGMPWATWLAQTGGAALVVVSLMHFWYAGLLPHADSERLYALAKALDERGATFYGAWWCPACQSQKDLFHGAADELPYVECSSGGRGSPMTIRCRDRGIVDYPTWIIDGRHHPGVLTPRELAGRIGFKWERPLEP